MVSIVETAAVRFAEEKIMWIQLGRLRELVIAQPLYKDQLK